MSNINEKNQGPRWYVAHTYTGYENKVKDSIEKIVENRGLGHLIYDTKVPAVKENVLDENGKPVLDKNGEEKIVETKLFPSYVFVKMTMNDESWHVVRNITGVTGFVGPGSEPTPLTDEEVEMFQVEIISEEFKFVLGDKVKVVSGIFEGYSGTIQEISDDKKSMTILASTERRDIPIMVETKDVALAD
ncbi:MAG: transcription termination/antitermination protein NusG [Clostridia bacterium]|nr:transcription termination/antitermination protein NusG [Clostridia bacterium]